MSLDTIKDAIRDIPDFPKEGIIYKDITPLLRDSKIFKEIIDLLVLNHKNEKVDYIIGVEARGFIFGAAMAYQMGCGFIPVRKKGKLPYETISQSYSLEYGEATLELHSDAIKKGDNVIIVDDLLATGGTVGATTALIEALEANIIGIDFLIELAFLNGIDALKKYKINSLIKF